MHKPFSRSRVFQCNGLLIRYVKLRFVHAPGITGTFSPPPNVSDPDLHHGTCMHVHGIANLQFYMNLVAGVSFPDFPAHMQPQFYVSGPLEQHDSVARHALHPYEQQEYW